MEIGLTAGEPERIVPRVARARENLEAPAEDQGGFHISLQLSRPLHLNPHGRIQRPAAGALAVRRVGGG